MAASSSSRCRRAVAEARYCSRSSQPAGDEIIAAESRVPPVASTSKCTPRLKRIGDIGTAAEIVTAITPSPAGVEVRHSRRGRFLSRRSTCRPARRAASLVPALSVIEVSRNGNDHAVEFAGQRFGRRAASALRISAETRIGSAGRRRFRSSAGRFHWPAADTADAGNGFEYRRGSAPSSASRS